MSEASANKREKQWKLLQSEILLAPKGLSGVPVELYWSWSGVGVELVWSWRGVELGWGWSGVGAGLGWS